MSKDKINVDLTNVDVKLNGDVTESGDRISVDVSESTDSVNVDVKLTGKALPNGFMNPENYYTKGEVDGLIEDIPTPGGIDEELLQKSMEIEKDWSFVKGQFNTPPKDFDKFTKVLQVLASFKFGYDNIVAVPFKFLIGYSSGSFTIIKNGYVSTAGQILSSIDSTLWQSLMPYLNPSSELATDDYIDGLDWSIKEDKSLEMCCKLIGIGSIMANLSLKDKVLTKIMNGVNLDKPYEFLSLSQIYSYGYVSGITITYNHINEDGTTENKNVIIREVGEQIAKQENLELMSMLDITIYMLGTDREDILKVLMAQQNNIHDNDSTKFFVANLGEELLLPMIKKKIEIGTPLNYTEIAIYKALK